MTMPIDPSPTPGDGATDFDGYTLDQLSDYLDAGMSPPDPAIDTSPECQLALAALRRVRDASAALLETEAAHDPPLDDRWVAGILGAISLDAHAGRTIPVSQPSPSVRITTTEGAVRGLIRAAGDEVAGLIVGRCRFDGDVTVPGAPIRIRVDASVMWGRPIKDSAALLQRAVAAAISAQTELNVTDIDVTVHDVFLPPQNPELTGGIA